MKNKIKKLCEDYALRIYALEDVIENLNELGDAVGSAEAEAEFLCLRNVVNDLGKMIEEPHKDKILTMEEMKQFSYEADYDLTFIKDGITYTFIYEAYADMILEYGQENVREGMGDVKNMIANGLYEKKKDTKLSLELINTYNFPYTTNKPDWDDVERVFKLPNGIELSCLTVCFNEPTEVDTLYGFEEYLQIETKEELDRILTMSYNDVVNEIACNNGDFPIGDYV